MAFQQGTRQYGPATARILLHNIRHGEKGQGWLVIAAAAVAVLALMIAAAALTMLFLGKSSETAQLSQMRQQLAAVQAAGQTALSQAEAASSSQYRSLSGKVATIDGAIAYFEQFSSTCSQDFTGPAGPAEFWIPCSSKLPSP